MLDLRVLLRPRYAARYDPHRTSSPIILLSFFMLLLFSVDCSSIVDLFPEEDGPCSISGNCKVYFSKPFRVTVYNHENYGLRYFSGKFNDPNGDYRIDGLPVDIVDIYFEADECFPQKLFDVKLGIGQNVADSISLNPRVINAVTHYGITLRKGDLILWPHGYDEKIGIDRLDFKSPAFKNFLIKLGVVSLLKSFPWQEDGVPDYFETRLGFIIDLSPLSRKYSFYFNGMRDLSMALDIMNELNKHQDIDRASIGNVSGAYY